MDAEAIAVENPATGDTLATVPALDAERDLGDGRDRPRGAAGVGRARLRRPGGGPARGADVAGRQRRARGADDLRRDRPAGRRDPVRRALLRPLGAGVLGEERTHLPGRRADRVGLAVRPRPPADRPLRPRRRRRRDRPVELPAEQLVRRLRARPGRRQRGRAQAVGGDPADLAADGRDARRLRHPRRRLPGRDRPRRRRGGAGRRGRLRDVHRLGRDRQEGDGAGGCRR